MKDSLTIIIPTRNRLAKLNKTLKSIPESAAGVPIRILIAADGDAKTAAVCIVDPQIDLTIHVRKHSGSVFCRNLMFPMVPDMVIYGTDDILFEENSIQRAIKTLHKRYPDGDGVIGFHQLQAVKYSIAGCALVGQKFLRRYPDKKLLYPGYLHFSCQEVARAGRILDRIYLDKRAAISHYHPNLYKDEMDKTHNDARRWRERDLRVSKKREANGLTWGING